MLMEHQAQWVALGYKVHQDRWASKGLRVGQESKDSRASPAGPATRDQQASLERQDLLDHLDYRYLVHTAVYSLNILFLGTNRVS